MGTECCIGLVGQDYFRFVTVRIVLVERDFPHRLVSRLGDEQRVLRLSLQSGLTAGAGALTRVDTGVA